MMEIIVALIVGIVIGVAGVNFFRKPKPAPAAMHAEAPYKLDVDLSEPVEQSVVVEVTVPINQPIIHHQDPDVTTPVLQFPGKSPKKTVRAAKKPNSPKKKKPTILK